MMRRAFFIARPFAVLGLHTGDSSWRFMAKLPGEEFTLSPIQKKADRIGLGCLAGNGDKVTSRDPRRLSVVPFEAVHRAGVGLAVLLADDAGGQPGKLQASVRHDNGKVVRIHRPYSQKTSDIQRQMDAARMHGVPKKMRLRIVFDARPCGLATNVRSG